MTRWMFASTLALLLGAAACSDRPDGLEDGDALALQEGPGSCPDVSPMLARFDANHDGVLQLSELPERARAHLAAADRDGDGDIDADELRLMRLARVEARFAQRDANGDGALDASEVGDPARWAVLSLADADGDGRVTLAELQAALAAGVVSPPCPTPHHGMRPGGGMGGPGSGSGSGPGSGTCPHDGTGTCPHEGMGGGHHGAGGYGGDCPHA